MLTLSPHPNPEEERRWGGGSLLPREDGEEGDGCQNKIMIHGDGVLAIIVTATNQTSTHIHCNRPGIQSQSR